MKIEQISVNEIKPFGKNAKKHDQRQIDNVAESIRQFGFAQPLVVDKDNVLIIGHCRLLASKKLDLDTVPVVRMNELTPEQVDKLRLLDNKLNESEWDLEFLSEDISELDFDGFDIDWELPNESDINDRTDINFNETVSVVIECENNEKAEEIFNELTSMGYECKISTL